MPWEQTMAIQDEIEFVDRRVDEQRGKKKEFSSIKEVLEHRKQNAANFSRVVRGKEVAFKHCNNNSIGDERTKQDRNRQKKR